MLIFPQYTAGTENLLDLLQRDDFAEILGNHNLQLTGAETYETGGFSIVVFLENNTVLKVSSLRCLEDNHTDSCYANIRFEYEDPDKQLEVGRINAHLVRESYSYTILDEDRQAQLAKPFFIPVYKEDDTDDIYDYLLCINLPLYEKLTEKLHRFNQKDVLKLTYDVLTCLEIAHNDGIRHGDIKPGNIMYDPSADKYVLIDWGTSYKIADIEAANFIFCRNAGNAFTPGYVDPERITKNSTAPSTDLYSLGITMAILAHPDGYFADRDFAAFHKAVCPNNNIYANATINGKEVSGEIPVLDVKVIDDISGNESYLEIVKNAITRQYDVAGNMLDDVCNALGIEKRKKVEESSARRVSINPAHGILATAFLVVYTLLLSGLDGLASNVAGNDNTAFSIFMAILCMILPAAVICISNFVINNNKSMTMKVRQTTLLTGGYLFFAIALPSWLVLKHMNIPCPLALNCFAFIVAALMCIPGRKTPSVIKPLVLGAIAGLCTALSTTMCLCNSLAEMFSAQYIEFMVYSVALGLVLGMWIWFLKFLWRTRLKKTH